MKLKKYLLIFLVSVFFTHCVGTDIIEDYSEPRIQIINEGQIPESLIVSGTYQFEGSFFNDIGERKNNLIAWESSDTSVITIDSNGLATAVGVGTAKISATAENDNPNTDDDPPITADFATIMVRASVRPLQISNAITSLEVGNTHQYNVAFPGMSTINWTSSNEDVASISEDGLLTAVAEGRVTITASTESDGETLTDETMLSVTSTSSKSGVLSGNYNIIGTVTLQNSSLIFSSDFNLSESLPGAYIYLSNNPISVSGALEVTVVTIFSGAHTIPLDSSVGIDDYENVVFWCKPFSTYVGHATLE